MIRARFAWVARGPRLERGRGSAVCSPGDPRRMSSTATVSPKTFRHPPIVSSTCDHSPAPVGAGVASRRGRRLGDERHGEGDGDGGVEVDLGPT